MLAYLIRVCLSAERAAATPVVIAVERPVSLPEERINRPVAERIPVLLETIEVVLAIDLRPRWRFVALGHSALVVARHDRPRGLDDLTDPIAGQPEADADCRQGLTRLVALHNRLVPPRQSVTVHRIQARSVGQAQSVRYVTQHVEEVVTWPAPSTRAQSGNRLFIWWRGEPRPTTPRGARKRIPENEPLTGAPTAQHADIGRHVTPSSPLRGVGAVVIVHEVPSHNSIGTSLLGSDDDPTAQHWVADAQLTPLSSVESVSRVGCIDDGPGGAVPLPNEG